MLHGLAHPNILKFHNWYETRNHFWLVLEYCPGGTLRAVVDQDSALPESTVVEFARDIAQGLFAVHSRGVVHGDLKPSNLMLNEYGSVKLCDFGLSRPISAPASPGSPSYRAPELSQGSGLSFASDLWAFGCILYELATGQLPLRSDSQQRAEREAAVPLIATCSEELNSLVAGLLAHDPSSRLSWAEVAAHPLWRGSLQVNTSSLQPARVLNGHARKLLVDESDSDSSSDVRTSEREQGAHFAVETPLPSEDTIHRETVASPSIAVKRLQRFAFTSPSTAPTEDTQEAKGDTLADLALHASDFAVKPVFGNRDIEKPEPPVSFSGLPLRPWPASDIAQMIDSEAVRSHLSELLATISGKSKGKVAVLAYFCDIVKGPQVANKFASSEFVPALVKVIRTAKKAAVRGKACAVIGQIMRHATDVDATIVTAEVPQALGECLKDKSEALRRKAAAALGEFCFFAACHMDVYANDTYWSLSPSQFQVLMFLLRPGEDETVAAYACKSIENILCKSRSVGLLLAVREMLPIAISLFRTSANEQLKASAAVVLSHTVRLSPHLAQEAMSRLGSDTLGDALSNGCERTQQAFLTLLLVAWDRETEAVCARLVPQLLPLMESEAVAIRGKALLLFARLLRSAPSRLETWAEGSFLARVECAGSDSAQYVQRCMRHLAEALLEFVETTLREFHLQGSIALTSLILQVSQLPEVYSRLPFSSCLSVLAKPLRDESLQLLLLFLEGLLGKVTGSETAVIEVMLPALCEKVCASPQARFMCVKLLSDVIGQLAGSDWLRIGDNSALLSDFLHTKFLALLPRFLADEDSIAIYAVKGLSVLLDAVAFDGDCAAGVVKLLAADCRDDSTRLTSHLLRALLAVVRSRKLTLGDYQRLGLVEAVSSLQPQAVLVSSALTLVFELLSSAVSAARRDVTKLEAAAPLLRWLPRCVDCLNSESHSCAVLCLTLMLQTAGTDHADWLGTDRLLTGENAPALLRLLQDSPLQLRVLKALRVAGDAQLGELFRPALERLAASGNRELALAAGEVAQRTLTLRTEK